MKNETENDLAIEIKKIIDMRLNCLYTITEIGKTLN